MRSTAQASILACIAFTALGVFTGCSRQGAAYNHNPMCKQAEQKCKLYYDTMDRTRTESGFAIDLLREDCEGSQRACAEGVQRSTESSHPGESGGRRRSYFDY